MRGYDVNFDPEAAGIADNLKKRTPGATGFGTCLFDANIIPTSEMLPESYQRLGAESAIIQQLSANFVLALR